MTRSSPFRRLRGKPDWTRYAKAAAFKRNDQMLDVLSIGVVVFPGSCIQENFADKARKMGIPCSNSVGGVSATSPCD